MEHHSKQTVLIASIIFSLLIFLWIFPGLFTPTSHQPLVADQENLTNQKTAKVENQSPQLSDSIKLIPFSNDLKPYRVKASGEDPFPVPKKFENYTLAFEKYFERFNQNFNLSFEGFPPFRPELFPVDTKIQSMVDFWVHAFGTYGKDQFIFHHRGRVDLVYSVLDLSNLDPITLKMSLDDVAKLKNQYLMDEKARIATLIKKIALVKNQSEFNQLTNEEKRLYTLFENESKKVLRQSIREKYISVYSGFKDQFIDAIKVSGKYLPEMEAIFLSKNLPIELTRLPFIESSFNHAAVSSANAVGVWQFIYDTGKNFLIIDDYLDERRDPIFSTYAAADFLEELFNKFNSWPLAINAYNTGPTRIKKAIQQLGSENIADIITEFKSPGYRFFSKNYYPEFIAANHVYNNRHYYFPELEPDEKLDYDLFFTEDEISLKELTENLDIDIEVMKQLNPGLKNEIFNGEKKLPKGYLVRTPHQLGALFASNSYKFYPQKSDAGFYIVKAYDNLEKIALQYDISIEVLEQLNNLSPEVNLTEGMILKIPHAKNIASNPVYSNEL